MPERPVPRRNGTLAETLEARRLLAFTINGTEAGNDIEMTVAAGTITVSVDGTVYTASDAAESSVIINGLGGNDTIRIHSTGANAVSAYGGANDDTFTFGEAAGVISGIANAVYADGGAGYNFFRFYDWSNTSIGNAHAISQTIYDTTTSAPVTYAGVHQIRVLGGTRADTFAVTDSPANSWVHIRPGTDTDSIHVNRTGVNSYVSIDPASNGAVNADVLNVGNGSGTAIVRQYNTMSIGSIVVNSGGIMGIRSGAPITVTTQNLSVVGTGRVDVADNSLVVDYGASPSPFATLRNLVRSGYNTGAWNGNGIYSSVVAGTTTLGVGVVDSTNLHSAYPQMFAGTQLKRPAVLIRQVKYGDANLDGSVNLDDFNRLGANFGLFGRQWFDADFDFDGAVTLSDFNRMAAHYNSTQPSIPLPLGVNVLDFGAIPNDGIDDTAAIRAAIDSIPLGDGAPIGQSPAGGVLLFPAGTFQTTGTIRLRSGIKLKGAGSQTILFSVAHDPNQCAVELYSPYVHGWNIGVTIEGMTIHSYWGAGLRIDPNMGGDVVDFRMKNVRVSAQRVGVDLRNKFMVHSELEDLEIFNPGSTALYTGRYDGTGFGLRLRNLKVTGPARGGFIAEKGLVMITSDVNVYGLSITTTGAPVTPLYLSGTITATDVDISPAVSAWGGVAVFVENSSRVLMDSVNNIGVARRLKLVNANDVQIGNVATDGTTSLLSQLSSIDPRSYLRVGNSSGGTIVPTSPAPQQPAYVPVPTPTKVIDVRTFGAIPNDGLDDTTAIQAAIDSIYLGAGLGATSSSIGGIVQFPHGAMNTSAPIRVPSGVWLRGQENGSVINNYMPPGVTGAAIELVSPFAHGQNIGAGIEGLGISTVRAAAIRSDASITGELRDLHIAGVRISSGGVGVDFRNVVVANLDVDRIVFTSPGTTAIWIGKPDNSSYGNVLRGLRMNGIARDDFVPERALWVMYGETRIEGGSLEDTLPPTPVLPFYGSGSIEIEGLYMEFPVQPDGLSFVFENAWSVRIDRLLHTSPQRRIRFINVTDARISNLNIDGTTAFLSNCIEFDATSRITIDAVNGQWDSGMLDHPQVIVKGFYNKMAGNFIETAVATTGPNLIKDPNFTSVGDDIWNESDWQIRWADGYSGRLGSFAVENVNGTNRLRIDVPYAMELFIKVRLNVPVSSVGKAGVARWRIDGPTQPFVYTKNFAQQYLARVTNSLTAAQTIQRLATADEIWIVIPNAVGTYYFSNFGVVGV